MADNVISMKKQNKGPKNPEEKVGTFVTRNRQPIIITSIIILVAAIGVCVAFAVVEKTRESGISKVDAIEYTLTKDSSTLSADEITTRQNKALEDVKPYLTQKNIVGVRANMLAADISFQKKDYNNSRTYWLAAVAAGKKAYTAPICWYNAAICSEELGDNESAAKQYESASNESDFLLVTHALFSLGRVKETLNDYTGASQAYQKMVDNYPNDDWTKLAQSRLISLKATGKIAETAETKADTADTKK